MQNGHSCANTMSRGPLLLGKDRTVGRDAQYPGGETQTDAHLVQIVRTSDAVIGPGHDAATKPPSHRTARNGAQDVDILHVARSRILSKKSSPSRKSASQSATTTVGRGTERTAAQAAISLSATTHG